MDERSIRAVQRLYEQRRLPLAEYQHLVEDEDPDVRAHAAALAREARGQVYGQVVYVRGLIEVSNICRNDCYYCGIRKSNPNCRRYALSPGEILACCQKGHALGLRSFVLQGGESQVYPLPELLALIAAIKHSFPDSALTLSLGEYDKAAYQAMYDAGADRYLLRHETADRQHYESLHPAGMRYERRMRCLSDLKEIGFQTGCGLMVGSPGQTSRMLAQDLQFIEGFAPEMCGIGPFIPHQDTRYKDHPAGSVALTAFLLSLLRLMHPNLLLPATTALGTLDSQGREKGIQAGANVVMPNLSPEGIRGDYALYDNKLASGAESAEHLSLLRESVRKAGCELVFSKGDWLPLQS